MSQNGVYDTCNISRWLAALSSYWSVISASKSGGLTVLVPDVVKRKRKKNSSGLSVGLSLLIVYNFIILFPTLRVKYFVRYQSTSLARR